MVFPWPWKADPSSPASFEKTLSAQAAKIADTQSRLERTRTKSRRVRLLWTLYLTFAYLVYAIVLLLVVGYKKLGAPEWSGIAAGPVLIYGPRTLITAYFNFRIDSLAARLKELQAERATTIQKLKDATKYDSTLELIEKYGGHDRKRATSKQDEPAISKRVTRGDANAKKTVPKRTAMAPPPTANIPRISPQSSFDPSADFAPNAFAALPPTYTHSPPPPPQESRWYDRLFDALLGEDEAAPKNRIVLICQSCRLVNGRASPGVISLAEVGTWRCMGCGATNGEELDEGKRIVREVLGAGKSDDGVGSDEDAVEEATGHDDHGSRQESSLDGSKKAAEQGDGGIVE